MYCLTKKKEEKIVFIGKKLCSPPEFQKNPRKECEERMQVCSNTAQAYNFQFPLKKFL